MHWWGRRRHLGPLTRAECIVAAFNLRTLPGARCSTILWRRIRACPLLRLLPISTWDAAGSPWWPAAPATINWKGKKQSKTSLKHTVCISPQLQAFQTVHTSCLIFGNGNQERRRSITVTCSRRKADTHMILKIAVGGYDKGMLRMPSTLVDELTKTASDWELTAKGKTCNAESITRKTACHMWIQLKRKLLQLMLHFPIKPSACFFCF